MQYANVAAHPWHDAVHKSMSGLQAEVKAAEVVKKAIDTEAKAKEAQVKIKEEAQKEAVVKVGRAPAHQRSELYLQ